MAEKGVGDVGAVSENSEVTADYVTKTELNAMLNGFRAAFKKDFSKLETAISSFSQPKEEGEAAAQPTKGKSQTDPEKAEMQKQIKLLLDREKEREAETASLKLNTALREHLTAVGVDPRNVEQALAYVSHKQLVKYDEEGNLKMKVNAVDYDISDGAKLWAKQDDAKLFLAPKGAVGSGQKGPVTQQTQSGPKGPDKNAEFMELLSQLPGAMNGI